MKIQLLSTNLKSQSLKRLAKALKEEVGYKVFRTNKIRAHRKQFLYGQAINKLNQYKWFKENNISSLDYTTNVEQVQEWLVEGHTVVGRKLLNSSCGKGIILLTSDEPITKCPVYTKYKKKKREFRVHVFKDTVVNIVEKKRKKGVEIDSKIRNHANGWVFCQEVLLSEELRSRIQQLATAAAKVSKSDFRGVDVGYNEKHDELFVIEVNSAPGIQGTNVNKYMEAILKHA